MLPLVFALPNVFATAHFAAVIVVGGGAVCSALVVVAYLLSGER